MTASARARRVDVTFSPPTPNGDLHLGHLSGPVLAADVCARSQKIAGHDVRFASSTDDNQTYVVTTAQGLGKSPEALIGEAMDSVSASLELGGVAVDLFARPDGEYEEFVRGFFTGLWEVGAFDRHVVDLPYDAEAGEYRAEAFVTGRCPTCLAHARAGVCEACGLYNLPDALLPVRGSASALPRRSTPIWMLDLERYRDLIVERYADPAVVLRPDLRGVVTETLRGRLPRIPITYPSTWGVRVDWDGPDARLPQAINAWPEIYVGHVHWLRRARPVEDGAPDELVQFIGIDNGFYNAFVYLVLSRLAVEHGLLGDLPATRTITNQYFLLEGRKFSTSKGDVLWARDYLERVGRDRARFVLALTSPELQQSEFTEQVASQTLRTRFDEPLTAIGSWLSVLRGRQVDIGPSQWWVAALRASVARFEAAYDLDRFSIRRAAEALAQHLEVLRLGLEQMRVEDPADVAGGLTFLWALRSLAWPITPDLAAQIAAAFDAGSARPPLWTEAHSPPRTAFRGLPAAVPATPAAQRAPEPVLAAD